MNVSLDDILVTGTDLEEHVRNLLEVLRRIEQLKKRAVKDAVLTRGREYVLREWTKRLEDPTFGA